MSEADDEAAKLERTLEAERRRLRRIGQETDAIDQEIDPPNPPIDHANDGGVI
jgi:hypothetical protein